MLAKLAIRGGLPYDQRLLLLDLACWRVLERTVEIAPWLVDTGLIAEDAVRRLALQYDQAHRALQLASGPIRLEHGPWERQSWPRILFDVAGRDERIELQVAALALAAAGDRPFII